MKTLVNRIRHLPSACKSTLRDTAVSLGILADDTLGLAWLLAALPPSALKQPLTRLQAIAAYQEYRDNGISDRYYEILEN